MTTWLLKRLKERSTWVGVFSLLTAAGVALSPELKEAITTLAFAVIGLIAILIKDKQPSA